MGSKQTSGLVTVGLPCPGIPGGAVAEVVAEVESVVERLVEAELERELEAELDAEELRELDAELERELEPELERELDSELEAEELSDVEAEVDPALGFTGLSMPAKAKSPILIITFSAVSVKLKFVNWYSTRILSSVSLSVWRRSKLRRKIYVRSPDW